MNFYLKYYFLVNLDSIDLFGLCIEGEKYTGGDLVLRSCTVTLGYSYDDRDLLISMVETGNVVNSHTNDNLGNRVSFTLQHVGQKALDTISAYDVMNQLYQVYECAELTATYGYNTNGNSVSLKNLTTLQRPIPLFWRIWYHRWRTETGRERCFPPTFILVIQQGTGRARPTRTAGELLIPMNEMKRSQAGCQASVSIYLYNEVYLMKISTKGRYALRMMLDLAVNQGTGYIALKDIAGRQGISKKYLEQIIPILNQSNILQTNRGYRGGYRLVRTPDQYTVGEILRITEGSLSPVACLEQHPNQCTRCGACMTLPVWKGLEDLINHYLDGITLQDILDQQKEHFETDYLI